jgi:hypothetical protein
MPTPWDFECSDCDIAVDGSPHCPAWDAGSFCGDCYDAHDPQSCRAGVDG